MSDNRKRTFEFVLYPEDSAPENWLQILKDTHVPMYISPLHNDLAVVVEDDNSIYVKPHRHVMLMFDGKKDIKTAYLFADLVNGAVNPKNDGVVSSPVSFARYLCHLDENPEEKKIYNIDEVIELNAVKYKYEDFIILPRDEFETLYQIILFLTDNEIGANIKSVHTFINYCVREKRLNWFKIARKNIYFIDRYLYSRNCDFKENERLKLQEHRRLYIDSCNNKMEV